MKFYVVVSAAISKINSNDNNNYHDQAAPKHDDTRRSPIGMKWATTRVKSFEDMEHQY